MKCPPKAHVRTLELQLVILYGKIVVPFGGTACLDEKSHWGKSLKLYSLVLFPVLSLLRECVCGVNSQPPVSASRRSLSLSSAMPSQL